MNQNLKNHIVFLSSEILSYGSYFRVIVNSRSVVFFLEKKRYRVSTFNEVFHVVFTSSGVNGPRCFINGKHTSWNDNRSAADIPERKNRLFIGAPVNIDFHLSELSLWSSEITPEQVLEEFQGNHFTFLLFCNHSLPANLLFFHDSLLQSVSINLSLEKYATVS